MDDDPNKTLLQASAVKYLIPLAAMIFGVGGSTGAVQTFDLFGHQAQKQALERAHAGMTEARHLCQEELREQRDTFGAYVNVCQESCDRTVAKLQAQIDKLVDKL